jgi:hypothetical protein
MFNSPNFFCDNVGSITLSRLISKGDLTPAIAEHYGSAVVTTRRSDVGAKVTAASDERDVLSRTPPATLRREVARTIVRYVHLVRPSGYGRIHHDVEATALRARSREARGCP